MPITKEGFQILVQVQEQDTILDQTLESVERIPVEIEKLRKNLQEKRQTLDVVKAKITQIQLKKKDKELELSQKEDAIRKHNMELNQIKTNEAFRALQSEIEQAKAAQSDFETEILMCMEELDEEVKQERLALQDLRAFETHVDLEIRVLETRKAELERKRTEQQSFRGTLAAQAPPELLSPYTKIRDRKKGIAIAPIVQDMCGACRIRVPPQIVVNATKCTELVSCENCQRILYRSDQIAAKAG